MAFIEFKNIGKKYAGAEKKSVDDFSVPFLITAHKKHQGAIIRTLRKKGILNIAAAV